MDYSDPLRSGFGLDGIPTQPLRLGMAPLRSTRSTAHRRRDVGFRQGVHVYAACKEHSPIRHCERDIGVADDLIQRNSRSSLKGLFSVIARSVSDVAISLIVFSWQDSARGSPGGSPAVGPSFMKVKGKQVAPQRCLGRSANHARGKARALQLMPHSAGRKFSITQTLSR